MWAKFIIYILGFLSNTVAPKYFLYKIYMILDNIWLHNMSSLFGLSTLKADQEQGHLGVSGCGLVQVQPQWGGRGCPGHLGIGGVLRDDKGAVKMVFSKKAGWGDANLAEALAVGEAMILFATSSWANSTGIIIESDSMNVVSWASLPEKSPWSLRQLFLQIALLKGRVAGWQIRHILRSGNEAADSLAKPGIDRSHDLLRICP
ncbi:Uncharacterized protein TCM_019931 [Theobroma cacao]|uniref:RNase H type-1 domain-containing protein n=1 Tax=Theobroma cacao TaxID=3641 RepID=A0A061ER20_THECC|nr:Uncharacterized protein TCM_019931 [Theobroma cacao]